MIMASLLLALLPTGAQAARTLQEGSTASYTIIYVDTNTPRINIATNTTVSLPLSNVALYVASNVVVASNPSAPGCVIYSSGTIVCQSIIGSLASNSVDTAKLAADSVDSTKLLNASVSTTKLRTDAVTASSILNGSIETVKIATDAIDTTKILVTGSWDSGKILCVPPGNKRAIGFCTTVPSGSPPICDCTP